MGMLKINWGLIRITAESVLSGLARWSLYLPFSWRGLSALILGVLLAKWFWIFFAPLAIYSSASPERVAGLEAGQLFGVALSNQAATEAVALPNVQLLGVFAASSGKTGFAIFKLDNNRQKGVAEGEEISPGTRLIAVHADHALLERAGVQQRVNLEGKQADTSHDAMPPGIKPGGKKLAR